jgi:hypothetical protein
MNHAIVAPLRNIHPLSYHMSSTARPSVNQLRKAIELSEKIQKLEAELAAILGNTSLPKEASTKAPKTKSAKRKKPVISAEGKERIAAAQRIRWAKHRKAKAAGKI